MHTLLSALPLSLGLTSPALPSLARWRRIRRERRQLLELSDHMLRDVGLTRAEAHHEAARPFWDVPPR